MPFVTLELLLMVRVDPFSFPSQQLERADYQRKQALQLPLQLGGSTTPSTNMIKIGRVMTGGLMALLLAATRVSAQEGSGL